MYAHEKPSDLEVERARLKSVIHGILKSSTTQRIFPLHSPHHKAPLGLVLLFVTSGNTKGSTV